MEKLELDKEKVIKAYNEGCFDVKKVLENMFGKETFQQQIYKAGQKFIHKSSGGKYILAQTDAAYINFISLTDGNRYTVPIKVRNAYNITRNELEKLFDNIPGNLSDFELIDN